MSSDGSATPPRKSLAGAKPSATVPLVGLCHAPMANGTSCMNQIIKSEAVVCAKHSASMTAKAPLVLSGMGRVKSAVLSKKGGGINIEEGRVAQLWKAYKGAINSSMFIHPHPLLAYGAMTPDFIPVFTELVAMGVILTDDESELFEMMKGVRVGQLQAQITDMKAQMVVLGAELEGYEGVDALVAEMKALTVPADIDTGAGASTSGVTFTKLNDE